MLKLQIFIAKKIILCFMLFHICTADALLRELSACSMLQLPPYLDAAFQQSMADGERAFARIVVLVALLLVNQVWRGALPRARVLEQMVVFQVKNQLLFVLS